MKNLNKYFQLCLLFVCINGCGSNDVDVRGRWYLDKKQVQSLANQMNDKSIVNPSKDALVLVLTEQDAKFLGTPLQWTFDKGGVNLFSNRTDWTTEPLNLFQKRNGKSVVRVSIKDKDTMILEDSQGKEFFRLKRENR